jgi:hypothetical protein
MVVIFVPNADECPVMQQLVPELYKNEVVLEVEADTSKKKEKELITTQQNRNHVVEGGLTWNKTCLRTSTC